MQPSLFDQPRIEAWEKVRASMKGRRRAVLCAVERLGPCTLDDLCRDMGVTPNVISGRITELERDKFIKCIGTQKRGTRSLSIWRAVADSGLLEYV